MTQEKRAATGRIILATLAGAGVGALAGVLLAPGAGRATRRRLEHAARHYGHELGEQAARILNELEASVSQSAHRLETLVSGAAGSGSLCLKSEWSTVRAKLKREYAHPTDLDLTYEEGQGAELVSRLQRKLGKGEADIIAILNAM